MTAISSASHTNLVDVSTLARHAGDPNWIVFDCRHDLTNPDAGRQAYAAGHIPGAIFLSVDDDLSGRKTGSNGRHPLPGREEFRARMQALGLGEHMQAVAYDAQGGTFAARLWWMLRWLGHEHSAVLDGSFAAWQSAGQPLERDTPPLRPVHELPLRPALTRSVDAAAVQAHLAASSCRLIDARAPERYTGENEPLDPVGGHIPGAHNRFFGTNLQPDGRFKSPEVLRDELTAAAGGYGPEDVVHQCGSGITACHNILAANVAGLPEPALYAGSWSEWIADPSRPVVRGA
jgi:thiosulfate/3-mercaptopyruvate sulfurtransferase